MSNIKQWIKETMESVWRGNVCSNGGGLGKWLYRQPILPPRLRGPGYTRPAVGTRRKHGKQREGGKVMDTNKLLAQLRESCVDADRAERQRDQLAEALREIASYDSEFHDCPGIAADALKAMEDE